MGTNFYARIIPSETNKDLLIEAIKNNDFNTIDKLYQSMYADRDDVNRHGSVIHLGKRSNGWKFLWNPNVIKYYNPDSGTIEYDYMYPLTKEGISEFLHRKDVVIYDEYGTIFDASSFMNMALNWCPDGYDSIKYENRVNNLTNIYHSTKMWSELGYIVGYYDFYSDGLLFSTSIVFS